MLLFLSSCIFQFSADKFRTRIAQQRRSPTPSTPNIPCFVGELFTLGRSAHRFVAIAPWFVHLWNFFFPTPPTSAKKEETSPSTGAKNVGAAPSSAAVNNVGATSSSARLKKVSAISTEGANSAGTASSGGKKPYIRYNVNSPEGQVMLAKYAQAIEIMRTLPEYDTHSWTWWWNTHWIKGPPAFLWDYSRKKKTEVIAALPKEYQADAEAVWDGCQAHPYNPSNPEIGRAHV